MQARREGSVLLNGAMREVGEADLWRTRVESAHLLIIDDLGLRRPTEAQYEVVYEIIDRRGRRPLALSANLSPDQLRDLYDDRVVSRLMRGTVIELDLPDRRIAEGRSYRLSAPQLGHAEIGAE